MIVIIDYGVGNIGSIANMIKKAGGECVVSSEISVIAEATKLILPGVGAFDNGMRNLAEMNLLEVLNKKVLQDKTPILGICLGMQLFTHGSEEGSLPGLGWLDAHCYKFAFDTSLKNLRIPHMGWNDVAIKKNDLLFKDMWPDASFYFVHSYYLKCKHPEDIAATTFFGFEFASTVQVQNICATQFHPEKSHKYGLKLIQNFVESPAYVKG